MDVAVTKTIYWMRSKAVQWRKRQIQIADTMFALALLMAACMLLLFLRIGHFGYTAFGLPRFDALDWILFIAGFVFGILTIYESYCYKKSRSEYQTVRKALVDRLAQSPCTCTTYCTCAEDFIDETYREYKINLYYD